MQAQVTAPTGAKMSTEQAREQNAYTLGVQAPLKRRVSSRRAGQSDPETPEGNPEGLTNIKAAQMRDGRRRNGSEYLPNGKCREMQDQEWHELIQDHRSTFPPDHSSIQAIFVSGRLMSGLSATGCFRTSTKSLKLRSRAGDTSRAASTSHVVLEPARPVFFKGQRFALVTTSETTPRRASRP